jgi:hypothetical protein
MSGIIDKIALLGREFTIQTELLPGEEVRVRTLVYDGGRLVTSREIPLDPSLTADEQIEAKVRNQHRLITDTLVKRAADLQATKGGAAERPAAAPPAPKPGRGTAKGTPRPEIEPGSSLEIAIAIRKTIGPFGLAFAHPAPTTASGYDTALEAVETAIDAIMKSPIYEHVRLDEQLTMIAIRGQLATWRLADKDIATATEIWPSIERFAYHQQKISDRRDLVAFDHKLLTWSMSQLGKGVITDELVDGLSNLAGRDAELDAFLARPDETEQMELLEILLRLIDQTLA